MRGGGGRLVASWFLETRGGMTSGVGGDSGGW